MVGLVVQFKLGREIKNGLVMRRWGVTAGYGVWLVRCRNAPGFTRLVHGSAIVHVYTRLQALGVTRESDIYP